MMMTLSWLSSRSFFHSSPIGWLLLFFTPLGMKTPSLTPAFVFTILGKAGYLSHRCGTFTCFKCLSKHLEWKSDGDCSFHILLPQEPMNSGSSQASDSVNKNISTIWVTTHVSVFFLFSNKVTRRGQPLLHLVFCGCCMYRIVFPRCVKALVLVFCLYSTWVSFFIAQEVWYPKSYRLTLSFGIINKRP